MKAFSCLRLKQKTEWTSPPRPKQSAPASQEMLHKKLKAPFRSPLVNLAAMHEGVEGVYSSGRSAPSHLVDVRDDSIVVDDDIKLGCTRGIASKERTARASKQFKSPIPSDASGPSGSQTSNSEYAFSNVQAGPLIQTLQANVQILKQAIRIKQSNSGKGEDDLEALTKKWKTAGRELAWAVWDTVKDLDPGENFALEKTKSGWFDDTYRDDARDADNVESGWGWNHSKEGDETDKQAESGENSQGESEKSQHTLGTMLRYMGIAPETLGWDEGEGDFVDAA